MAGVSENTFKQGLHYRQITNGVGSHIRIR